MFISDSVVMMLHIWHHGFSYLFLPVDVAVCGSFDFMLLRGLCAQIGVTSNGCSDSVNYFIIVLLTRYTDGW